MCAFVIQALRRVRQEVPWSSLARQPSQIREFQVQRDAISKDKVETDRGIRLTVTSDLPVLVYTHVHTQDMLKRKRSLSY